MPHRMKNTMNSNEILHFWPSLIQNTNLSDGGKIQVKEEKRQEKEDENEVLSNVMFMKDPFKIRKKYLSNCHVNSIEQN